VPVRGDLYFEYCTAQSFIILCEILISILVGLGLLIFGTAMQIFCFPKGLLFIKKRKKKKSYLIFLLFFKWKDGAGNSDRRYCLSSSFTSEKKEAKCLAFVKYVKNIINYLCEESKFALIGIQVDRFEPIKFQPAGHVELSFLPIG